MQFTQFSQFTQSIKRLLLGILVTLIVSAFSVPSFAAITFVQSRSVVNGSGTSGALAYTSNVTAGSFLAAHFIWDSALTITVTDSQGNTLTPVGTAQILATYKEQWFYGFAGSSGADTVTGTFSGTSSLSVICIHEFSGIKAFSGSNLTGTGTGTAIASGSLTTTVANSLLLGSAFAGGSITALDPAWSLAENPSVGVATAYRILSSTGSYQTGFTQTPSSIWHSLIIAGSVSAQHNRTLMGVGN